MTPTKCPHEYYEISNTESDLDLNLLSSDFKWKSLKKNNGHTTCKKYCKVTLAHSVFQPNASKLSDTFDPLGLDFLKAISLKDEKILEEAIEIANKISSKSIEIAVNDIPCKKKFGMKLNPKVHSFDSFKANHSDMGKSNVSDFHHDVKSFSEKLKFQDFQVLFDFLFFVIN